MGHANVKEDGLRSFLWSKRWIILTEHYLTIHKNQQSKNALASIPLKSLTGAERTNLKPFCILLELGNKKYFLYLQSDNEAFLWLDLIYLVFFIMTVA